MTNEQKAKLLQAAKDAAEIIYRNSRRGKCREVNDQAGDVILYADADVEAILNDLPKKAE